MGTKINHKGGETMKTKYQIWDKNRLVPAFCRKPKDPRAELLGARDAAEQKLRIKYYIPADKLRENE